MAMTTAVVAAMTMLHWTKDKYILCKQSVARRRKNKEIKNKEIKNKEIKNKEFKFRMLGVNSSSCLQATKELPASGACEN